MTNAVKYDAFDDYMFSEHWTYDPPGNTSRTVCGEPMEDACQDVFSMLFKKRWDYTNDAPDAVKAKLETLRNTEEYRTLRDTTTMRDGPAYEAARRLVMDYVDSAPADPNNEEAQRRERQAARSAAQRATKDAEEYEEMETLLGFGPGCQDENGDTIPPAQRIEGVRKFMRNSELRRIMKLAGRLINIAETSTQTETTRGVDKLVGVEVGDELNRVLPGELWVVEFPELFGLKLINKELQQYRYEGEKTKGRGPIVVCFDKSSSMGGSGIDYARAFLFGMAHIAGNQKRALYVIPFNATIESVKKLTTLPAFTEWLLSVRAQGGTNFDKPLRAAMDLIATTEKTADIVMLTDGDCEISTSVVEKVNKAREEGLKVLSICVGDKPRSLRGVSTEVLELSALLRGGELTDEAANASAQVYKGVMR